MNSNYRIASRMLKRREMSKELLIKTGFYRIGKDIKQWVADCYNYGGQQQADCQAFLALLLQQARSNYDYAQRKTGRIDRQQAYDKGHQMREALVELDLKADTIEYVVAKHLVNGHLPVDIAYGLDVSRAYISQVVSSLRDIVARQVETDKPGGSVKGLVGHGVAPPTGDRIDPLHRAVHGHKVKDTKVLLSKTCESDVTVWGAPTTRQTDEPG